MVKKKITTNKDRDEFVAEIMAVELDGKTYNAEFKLHRKKRTLPQNKLYRLWLAVISDYTGSETGDLHDFFRSTYLPQHEVNIFGRSINRIMSTTDLDTYQFTQYLECIKRWSDFIPIALPDPKDREFERIYEHYKNYIG